MTQFGWPVFGAPGSCGALSKVVPSDHTSIGMPPNVRVDRGRYALMSGRGSKVARRIFRCDLPQMEEGGTMATQL